MIYGVPIDTVVSGIIIVCGTVMALPALMGLAMIVIDVVLWYKERRKHK